MGVDGTSAHTVQALEFAGRAKVVLLYPEVQGTKRDDQCNEDGRRCGDDYKGKSSCQVSAMHNANSEVRKVPTSCSISEQHVEHPAVTTISCRSSGGSRYTACTYASTSSMR